MIAICRWDFISKDGKRKANSRDKELCSIAEGEELPTYILADKQLRLGLFFRHSTIACKLSAPGGYCLRLLLLLLLSVPPTWHTLDTCTHEYIDAYVGDNDAALSSRIWPVYSSTNTLHSTLGKAINNEIHFFIQLFIIIFLFFFLHTVSQVPPYIEERK